jgi:hypothetical protein
MPNSGKTQRTIIWAVVVLFISTLACTVVLEYVGAESGVVTAVLASLAPTAAVLAAMRQTAGVEDKLNGVRRDTHALTNGLLDSKVRAGVAEVLPDHLVDDEYHDGKRAADEAVVKRAHVMDPPEDPGRHKP